MLDHRATTISVSPQSAIWMIVADSSCHLSLLDFLQNFPESSGEGNQWFRARRVRVSLRALQRRSAF